MSPKSNARFLPRIDSNTEPMPENKQKSRKGTGNGSFHPKYNNHSIRHTSTRKPEDCFRNSRTTQAKQPKHKNGPETRRPPPWHQPCRLLSGVQRTATSFVEGGGGLLAVRSGSGRMSWGPMAVPRLRAAADCSRG
jgi:hypothetical protein